MRSSTRTATIGSFGGVSSSNRFRSAFEYGRSHANVFPPTDSIFAQPDAAAVHAQFARVTEQLHERFPAAAEMLEAAGPDILSFSTFPQPHWRQIWSNTQFMMRDVGVGRAA
jgi:transposase-like protein